MSSFLRITKSSARSGSLLTVSGLATLALYQNVARVLEFSLDKPSRHFAVSAEPVLVFADGRDRNSELDRPGDIVLLSDGSYAIANAGSSEIKQFDRYGNFLRNIGRQGNGPGEFQALLRLWVIPGDTLLASDGMLRRIVLFDRGGKHVRTVTLSIREDMLAPRIIEFLPPDRLLVSSALNETLAPRAEPYYSKQRISIYGTDGTLRGTLGTFPDGEYFVQVQSEQHPERGNSYWSRAYGRRLILRAVGTQIAIGDGTSFEVRLYSLTGLNTTVLRTRYARRPVTPEDRRAFGERSLTNYGPLPPEMMKRMVQGMPFPEAFPVYQHMLLATNGTIWIKQYQKPSDPRELWWLIGTNGVYIGSVILPPSMRLKVATAHTVIGLVRDSDGIDRVEVYRF